MTQVVELSGDEKALLQSYDRAIKKQVEFELALRNGGAAGDAAGTQIEGALEKIRRANDQALKGLLGDLGKLGPEGSAAAEALKGHFTQTGQAGYQSFHKILDQIRAIDPAAADAAAAARTALHDAANSSETQFHDVLEEMRALGPEGRKAADEIKASLVAAGKLSVKSIEDIAAAFDKIDPEAAKAARAVISNMKQGTDESADMFRRFKESAVTELAGIATAYIGIGEAVQLVNAYLEMQRERMAAISSVQSELATEQERAAKNLVGLEKADRMGLLGSATAMTMETGAAPERITAAIGEVASMGLSDPEAIKTVVREAAKVSRLEPGKLPDVAGGAADIMGKTGIDDARKAIGLFVTAQTESQVGSADKVQGSLPVALGSAIATARGQSPEEAAREGATLWAKATQAASDDEGRASATFVTDLMGREAQFFGNLEQQRIDARSQIDLLTRKKDRTEAENVKLTQLEQFLKASDGLKDPGTQFGRLEALRDPALRRQFLGPAGSFGETRFATFLNDLLDNNSSMGAELNKTKDRVRADVEKFTELSDELKTATPQLRSQVFAAESENIRRATEADLVTEGDASKIQSQSSKTMKTTYATGLQGTLQWLGDWSGWGAPTNAGDQAITSIQQLQQRISSLKVDGVTPDEATKITNLELQIQKIFELIEGGSGLSPADARSAAARAAREAQSIQTGPSGLARDAMSREDANATIQALKKLEVLLERVATNTAATAASNQQMVEPAKETAANTGKKPLATPALGAQTP